MSSVYAARRGSGNSGARAKMNKAERKRYGIRKSRFAILTLILFLGFSLRIHRLGRESLWLDEGGSLRVARSTMPRLVGEIAGNYHPPL
jgi:hypothetical protein